MPVSGTITPRYIYLEDIATTTNPSGETASVNVMGAVGNPQTLNKLAVVLLTSFGQYANDAAAAAGGVGVGALYYNTGDSKLHARLT